MHRKPFGDSIEALVCTFLEQRKLRCVAKNFSCRLGEIDLIMLEPASNTLVFVEVRFRARFDRGTATESVDWKKQRKLRRTVLHYLQKHADARQAARIDVVGVTYKSQYDASVLDELMAVDLSCERVLLTHEDRRYELVWTRNAVEG